MITINELVKYYGDLLVVDKITFEIKEGEVVSIVGPSGAGKSTILRCIAGLDKSYDGEILIKGVDGAKFMNENRIALVAQKYSNYPWLNVFENVKLAFHNRNETEKSIGDIIEKLLNDIGLWEFRDYYINQLSGGMQQRVAIARALAQNTKIIALDEPFGALDATIRENLQLLFKGISRDSKKTAIFVTHDIEEAIFISNKIIVVSKLPSRIIRIYDSKFYNILDPEVKLTSDFIQMRRDIQNDIM